MAINMNTAKKLCTKPELELVLKSTRSEITGLSARELRMKVRRARTLRDKYQTLASRQRRIARGKGAPRGKRPSQSNENTLKKREIFGEVLTRFETKLAKIEREQEAAERAAEAAGSASGGVGRRGKVRAKKRTERTKKSGVSAARRLAVSAGASDAAWNTSLRTRSKASQGKRVKRRQQSANRPAILGHVSSRGRRRQARRDSR